MSDFRKQYLFKLLTNLIRLPVSFVLQALYPRMLGPVNYGNFDFLTDSANKFIGFFESGTSIAFYNNLSRNIKDRKLIRFYFLLASSIALVYLIFAVFAIFFNFKNFIWPGHDSVFIILSLFWGIVTFFSNISLKIIDASHLTVANEKFRIYHLLFSLIIMAIIYFLFKNIDLLSFFIIQIFLLLLLIFGAEFILNNNKLTAIPRERISMSEIKKYTKIFWDFSNPLITYSIFSLVAGIGERLILQQFGGSIQQAYFGISYRIGAFVFVFTSAMIPLLMREFSKLSGNNDNVGISNMMITNVKVLYFISTALAVFVAANTSLITRILGGGDFSGARGVVFIMAFYPIHQTLGQICSSVFYSTNRTKEYRNIGMFIMPMGLALSFFLIAPSKFYGMNFGAIGLAIQMVLIQVVSVNLLLYFNCKYLNVSYLELCFFQILIALILLFLGYILNLLIHQFFIDDLLRFLTFGFIYFIFLVSMIALRPKLFGLNNFNFLKR